LESCKPHEKNTKKHQNARFVDEKLKAKSLMFFVSFFQFDLQDFWCNVTYSYVALLKGNRRLSDSTIW